VKRSVVVVGVALVLLPNVPAAGQIAVSQPAVTIIVDPQSSPSAAPPAAPTAQPTEVPGPQTIPTIPTADPASSSVVPTQPRALTTVPATVRPTTTKVSRRTTTTKRSRRTTLAPSTTFVTTTVLELVPIPDGASSTVPPVVVGDTAPTTATAPAPATEPSSTRTKPSTSSKGSPTGPSVSSSTTSVPAATPAELKQRIDTEIQKAGGTPGVIVIVDGQTMADIGSTQPRLPASTQKLYVAAAALTYLGPDFHFDTLVKFDSVTNGSIATLTLVGAGDPTLSTANLRSMASQVRAAGVTTITQQLLVDDSHFDRITTGPGWKPEFSPGEAGLLSALMVDGNHRNDAAFRADPALANLTKFQQELQRAGITLAGAALGRGAAPGNATVVVKHRSDALSAILSTMAKKSNNTYAEMVLKEIGAANGSGSTAAGAAAVSAYTAKIGVTAPGRFVDGSGLSSLNRTTAASEAALLAKVETGKHAAAFRSALAIACVDGTMRNRLCGTRGAGTVFAKTGTINNVAALSGYGVTASGRKVVFSFLLNDLKATSTGRVAIDKALLQIVNYAG
jgi:serine-type D-Ala-D-Ala carboxypeptidase/endopeptidase (penicillin-binding protein 4)